ncbi:peptidylprolyl isomerase PrsA [Loigolactobacillus backii]|uniref:Foldase protein PrsA n=1 Tax=Loigolactobacillus backii TaxID=375175 RepID=A0A192H381_9LACO|nr:peptidylprolyl isomerase PrsA [Loigolactobacillus backii]ANK59284.1 peptidylprolyl isomerase [Loigolactobacillus backii]ANK62697.1 peptidylprolyl isomerase [Loigolactobacillus backii]ANK64276.1 peptidylprolyl isomerase [Loigolactobacillus backii]ANK67330.1 peptidylprolyl isomerase [Loigolactobacillus backii]ANK70295.1 peptidylprolyl isomerase [Loigolactobacillus backii]
MRKKWLLSIMGIFLAFTLAGCGSKTVATTSGGNISQQDYYNEMKKSSSGKQTLQQMILDKVMEKQYGSKVSKDKVDKQYNSYKKQYGSSFSSVLSQNDMTKASFKKNLRSNLLLEEAVKDNVKITNADLKKQWKTYQPKVTVQHILVAKKSTATDVINELNKDNSEKNFKALAKKYSTDTDTKNDAGKLPAFDSTDTSLDSSFKTAAFKLKTNEYTKTPVKSQYGYHVIRMINHPAKGTMKEHEATLKAQIYSKDMSNNTVLKNVISKVLKKGNVQIKDNDLKDVLSGYVGKSSTTTSSTSN